MLELNILIIKILLNFYFYFNFILNFLLYNYISVDKILIIKSKSID
jgi:hypothetical protein